MSTSAASVWLLLLTHIWNGLRQFAVWMASQNQFDADATVVSARNV